MSLYFSLLNASYTILWPIGKNGSFRRVLFEECLAYDTIRYSANLKRNITH